MLCLLRACRTSESTVSHFIGLVIHRDAVLHKNSLGKTGSGFHFHSLSFTAVVGELHLDVALVVGSVVIAVDDPDGLIRQNILRAVDTLPR